VSAVTAIQDVQAGRAILGRDPIDTLPRANSFAGIDPVQALSGGVYVPAIGATEPADMRHLLAACSGTLNVAHHGTSTFAPLDMATTSHGFAGTLSLSSMNRAANVSEVIGLVLGAGTTQGQIAGMHFMGEISYAEVAGGSALTSTGAGAALTFVGRGAALAIVGTGSPLISCTGAPTYNTRSVLERCCELLLSRCGLLRSQEVSALKRQLIALLSDADEIAESGPAVSTRSLDGLIEFLAEHRPRVHPALCLTRGGLFAASWSPHPRAKLTLTFTHDAAEWVGVDLAAVPPARDAGAVVIGALAGMPQPFRGWIVD
jgi:hypothetical protein